LREQVVHHPGRDQTLSALRLSLATLFTRRLVDNQQCVSFRKETHPLHTPFDTPRASARDEHDTPHRGLDRTTRIWASSRLITASAAPEAGCPRRSTNSSTATGSRWSWSHPAKPASDPSCARCWSSSA